jgi:poly-beta-1,6-N-acetyl-D-glucosamine synthase
MRTALEIVLWTALALIVWTQLGYAAVLVLLARVLRGEDDGSDAAHSGAPSGGGAFVSVSLIVAAHDEQESIAAKVRDALAQDYPRARLEVVVACDGCTDATAQRAREAGADVVLELAWRVGGVQRRQLAVGAGRAARARGRV